MQMNQQFRARIRNSLANQNLQTALDANAEHRLQGRTAALASLPDWKERRQRAHALRADTIAHLDEYLNQFIASAKANGVIVHRAADAEEANKIILQIVEADGHPSPPKLIAKSKSMLSEEIELNRALEAAGHQVVETDLGEYIVQLRHERPAHITTPAVHLRRDDVGQLFHEKLGIPYTEDVPTLTKAARKVLREVFLNADVGISGVNFGVAETGGICLVTNEGNGRMVTTLPRVHIALMGLERLVPTPDDLALMLSLLPRSSTGQKLTVYTQLVHAPLPNQERHIVILDNGRARLRRSPLAESLYCIRCGACLNACPVFRELGGHAYGSVYSGPIGSVISAGLFGSEFAPLAQASSLCGACKDVCPVDIDLPKLLTRVRAGQMDQGKKKMEGAGLSLISSLFMRMYSRIARDPSLFAISQRFAALTTFLVSPFSSMLRLPAFTGWGYSKDFPRFAAKPFRARFSESGHWPQEMTKQNSNGNDLPAVKTQRQAPALPKAEQFTAELAAVGGHVVSTEDPTREVIEFLKARRIDQIHLEPNTLDESRLSAAGITFTGKPDPAIRVGVTKAVCGLADSGSILIADGEGNPLHASLLTEVHIAVLKKSNIYPSLENGIPLVSGTKSAVFITGPSRTADIEMTLTIGVHGPGEVHVFLVDG